MNGFTLTNGATRTEGDLTWEGFGGGVWCEQGEAIVTNCIISGNSAYYSGGGVYQGTLNRCRITGNSAGYSGGGAYLSILNNCSLTTNAAQSEGGGAADSELDNCSLVGNSAGDHGGGTYNCWLRNCTLLGNSADYGGGVSWGGLYNCIVYYNNAKEGGSNFDSGIFDYCCTTPLPEDGTNNITSEPLLASASHLSSGSPCRGAGSTDSGMGKDIDGESWLNPPSIGCDEFYAGSATGPLAVTINADWTNVTVGFVMDLKGMVLGYASASVWDFGDGVVVSNQPWTTHSWSALGTYPLVLTAYNDSNPGGVRSNDPDIRPVDRSYSLCRP